MEGHHILHLSDDHLKKPKNQVSITMGISYHHGYSSARYYTTDFEKLLGKGFPRTSPHRAVSEVTLKPVSAHPILELWNMLI